jgi:hypothetical protein
MTSFWWKLALIWDGQTTARDVGATDQQKARGWAALLT